jgi:hypothetical protein
MNISVEPQKGKWLIQMLDEMKIEGGRTFSLQEIKESYEQSGLEDFELFWDNKPVNTLNKVGLLRL